MPLPWVRLDTNIASHPKILALLQKPAGPKAFVLYTCALGYSGGHGTDGLIPFAALPMLHGTRKLGDLLVEVALWEPHQLGWMIHNYAHRQELEVVTAGKREMKRMASEKGNCARWHGPDCWQAGTGCQRGVEIPNQRLPPGIAGGSPR